MGQRRLTDCNRVDHGSNFRDTPTHDQGSDGQVFLESCADYHKTTNIERNGDVTRPGEVLRKPLNSPDRSDVPKTGLGHENTLISSNAEIHNPVIEISTKDFTDKDSYDWCSARKSSQRSIRKKSFS